MEQVIVEELDKVISNGVTYQKKRISLVNPKKENVLAKAQSYFTKDQIKEANINYLLRLFNSI